VSVRTTPFERKASRSIQLINDMVLCYVDLWRTEYLLKKPATEIG